MPSDNLIGGTAQDVDQAAVDLPNDAIGREDRNCVAGVFVFRERDELYARIDRRVEQMFRSGVIEEARMLGELGPTAARSLGLIQLLRTVV